MDFPYYSLREGFDSQLYLVSTTNQPTDLTLAVYSQRGASVLSSVAIQPSAKLAIDLLALLTQHGADVNGDFGEGSIAVYFEGTMMPVAGQVTVSNSALRLVYESEMVENDPGRTDIPSVLNGLWWNLAPGRDARVMVANMSSSPVTADVFLDYLGQRHASAPLAFNPHQLKLLSVIELLGQQQTNPSQAPEGGITIVQHGGVPSLIAQGKMLDPVTGFSTTMDFPPPQLENASALHATGIPIGTPSKDSPFAGMGYFTPHVVVRNLAATPQTAIVTVEYPSAPGWDSTEKRSSAGAGAGSSGTASSSPSNFTAQLPLAPLTVGAYSAQDVSLDSVVGQLPQPIPYVSIRIQYSGTPGSMIAEVSSVELQKDLVMDAKVENEANGWAGSGANPWHLDGQTESYLFLTDMGEQPARIGFKVWANGKVYYLGKLQLIPHETRMIDLRKLRDAQRPDLEKNKIPAGASDGSVLWTRLDNVPVMGRLAVVTRQGGVASSYDCTQCQCPAYYTTTIVNGCPVVVTGTDQQAAEAWFEEYCSDSTYYQDITDDSYWSSSNSSVFTVSNSSPIGLLTALSGGTANAVSSGLSSECTSWVLNGYSCECEGYTGPSGSGSCSVQPNITSISPALGLIGGNTSVTISGTGFGDSQGTGTVGAGSNITFEYSSWSDTLIQVTFQVGSNAPGGNHGITVTTTGGTSNSVNFYVQVPTSLSIVAGTNTTTSEATCTTSGSTGCGVTRTFTYQVNDQETPPQPITGSAAASFSVWDAIVVPSGNANPLNLTTFTTTCTGTAAGTNNGPCSAYVNSSGQFAEKGLTVCATVCYSNKACVSAGPTNANQTWHLSTFSIVQSISYYCGKVLVNGNQGHLCAYDIRVVPSCNADSRSAAYGAWPKGLRRTGSEAPDSRNKLSARR